MPPITRMDENPGDDIASRIWIGTIVTVVPATIITALRFTARIVSRVGLWWDDYTIAVALVSSLAINSRGKEKQFADRILVDQLGNGRYTLGASSLV